MGTDPPSAQPAPEPTDVELEQSLAEDNAEVEWIPPRHWMRGYLVALSQSGNQAAACREIGITDQSVRNWKARDEGFALEVLRANERASELLEQQARVWATVGVEVRTVRTKTGPGGEVETTETVGRHRSPQLLVTLLRATNPAKYREHVRIDGPGGGPLEHKVSIVDEAKAEFYAELDRVGSS